MPKSLIPVLGFFISQGYRDRAVQTDILAYLRTVSHVPLLFVSNFAWLSSGDVVALVHHGIDKIHFGSSHQLPKGGS